MIFTIIFLPALGACGPTKTGAVTAQAQPCPRPVAPKMKRLDPGESVCSKKNVEATAANASALRGYADGLAATVECYEGQVE